MREQPESKWADSLRAVGLRVTPVRLAVLEHLEKEGEPRSAVDVAEGLEWTKGDPSDRVTIYRTMHALVDSGLVTREDPGDRVWRFALAADDHDRHAHLVCDECGSVTCVEEAMVSAATLQGSRKRRFRLKGASATLHGTCEECWGS